jgi:hypothetical protein
VEKYGGYRSRMDIERSALLARDRLTDAAVRAAHAPAKEHAMAGVARAAIFSDALLAAVRARLAELKSVAK